MSEKTRYSDQELQEFKELILEKLEKAQRDYEILKNSVLNHNGTEDTEINFNMLEEACNSLNKAEVERLSIRQIKFINSLRAALVRIENKTYGVCRETGKLISKERLRAVPHATLSIKAKELHLA